MWINLFWVFEVILIQRSGAEHWKSMGTAKNCPPFRARSKGRLPAWQCRAAISAVVWMWTPERFYVFSAVTTLAGLQCFKRALGKWVQPKGFGEPTDVLLFLRERGHSPSSRVWGGVQERDTIYHGTGESKHQVCFSQFVCCCFGFTCLISLPLASKETKYEVL